jgi:glycosyltransferase involved in cell wall biosynthesis
MGTGMKIVYLSKGVYPYALGGVEWLTYFISEELSKFGYESEIVITRTAKAKVNLENRIHVGLSLTSIIKTLKNINYDILFIHSFEALGLVGFTIVTLFNFLVKNKPLIFMPHGSLKNILYQQKGLTRRIYSKILNWYVRILSIFMRYIIVPVTQKGLWEKAGFSAKKVKTVKFPVYFERLKDGQKSKKDERYNKILYVGRIDETKGITCLIRALPEILVNIPNVVLYLVGDGEEEYKNELKKIIKDLGVENNVVFYGYVPHDCLAEVYSQADVFVLPSIVREAFPLSLMEAMLCKLPVITTNIDAQNRLVKDKFNGFLVRPGDPTDLSEKICMILKNGDLARELGENGQKYAQQFSREKFICEIIKICRSSLAT